MPTVQDILSKKSTDVVNIGEDATVKEAAKIMSDHRIGALVVVRGDSVIGIFTERDALYRVVAASLDPATTRVKDVMTAPVACCKPCTKLAECRGVMSEKRIRHMPVVEDNRLVGMLSSRDLLASEHHEQRQTIEYLHAYLHEGTR